MFKKLSLKMKLIIFFILSIIVIGIVITEFKKNNDPEINLIEKISEGEVTNENIIL